MCSSVLPTFSSMMVSVAHFMPSTLIHSDWSFVHDDRYGSIFILVHVDIQLCQHHLLNMLSFSIEYFLLLCQNQVFIGVWIGIRVFDSVPLVLLSVFMLTQSCFPYCSSVIKFRVRDYDACKSSFTV